MKPEKIINIIYLWFLFLKGVILLIGRVLQCKRSKLGLRKNRESRFLWYHLMNTLLLILRTVNAYACSFSSKDNHKKATCLLQWRFAVVSSTKCLIQTHSYDVMWSWSQANARLCNNILLGYTHNQSSLVRCWASYTLGGQLNILYLL
jgi:hypothetical protein